MEIVTVEEFIKKYLNRELVLEEYLFKTEVGLLYIEEIDLIGNGEIKIKNIKINKIKYLTKDDKLYKIKGIKTH